MRHDSIRDALLAEPSVAECVVVERVDSAGVEVPVALVVPALPLTTELWSRYRDVATRASSAAVVVPLSALPLSGDGDIDLPAVSALPVLDDDVRRRWEERLRAHGLEGAAVVFEGRGRPQEVFHLSDLLPPLPTTPSIATPERAAASSPRAPGARPAFSDGGALRPRADAPRTLVEALMQAAEERPARGIRYIGGEGSDASVTYADLLSQAASVAAGLCAAGLSPGSPAMLLFEDPPSFVPAFWSCILAGIPALPSILSVDSHASAKAIDAWEALGRPLVLTSAHTADRVGALWKRAGVPSPRTMILEELSRHAHAEPTKPDPDALALLLATSGSTGKAKLVTHTHRTILAQCAATTQMNGFTPDEISLNWFPLDHVGGLVMFHVRDVYLRCQQIQASIDLVLKAPLRWLEWIDEHRATVTWAPNFAYSLVTSRATELARRRFDLSSMRFVLNGGEAIVARQARRFLGMLAPHGLRPDAMHPAWGMSETCSGIVYSERFSLATTSDEDPFVEVGLPLPGATLRVVDADGRLLEEGEVGLLEVTGPSIMPGYYENLEANAEAFSADRWLCTGDLAFLRDGRLTITGREKDVLIVNGVNYSSHEVEGVVEELDGVAPSYTAAVAVRQASDATDALAVFFSPAVCGTGQAAETPVVPHEWAALAARIRDHVARRIGVIPDFVIPVEAQRVPKTAIGKIQRSRLRTELEAGGFAETTKAVDVHMRNARTMPAWFHRRVWQRSALASGHDLPHESHVLVFLDRSGLGEALATALGERGFRVTRVEEGTRFVRSSASRYRIALAEAQQYRELIEQSVAESGPLACVVHLWASGPLRSEQNSPASQERDEILGVASAARMIQCLAASALPTGSLRMVLASSHVQASGERDEPYLASALLSGLAESLRHEVPSLDLRSVELLATSAVESASWLLHEITAPSQDRVVAYRHGRRFVRAHATLDAGAEPPGESIIAAGKTMVLVEQGTRGATDLSRQLERQVGARLLVLRDAVAPEGAKGRRERLPAAAVGGDTGGGEVREVDLADPAQVSRAFAEAEERWGRRIDAVIDVAGTWPRCDLRGLDVKALGQRLQRRISQLANLGRVIRERDTVFVSVASSAGMLGVPGFTASALEASLCEALGDFARAGGHGAAHTILWAMNGEDEAGMDEDVSRDLPAHPGYEILTRTQAQRALLAVTCRRPSAWLVGGDTARPDFARTLHGRVEPLVQLSAHVPCDREGVGMSELPVVLDRFGRPTGCDVSTWSDMRAFKDGSGAESRAARPEAGSAPSDTPPLTGRVRRVVAEILQLSPDSLEDGAPLEAATPLDSLALVEIVVALEEEFQVQINGDELHQQVSVDDLARAVERASPA